MPGLIWEGENIASPPALDAGSVLNFRDTGFKRPVKRGIIEEFKWIVIHENAGSVDPKRVSDNFSKYGYHIMVDRRGDIFQTCDLEERVWHAGQCNTHGLAICVLNSYYPRISPGSKTIPAQWWTHCSPKHKKEYIIPTDEQLETMRVLVPWLADKLGIPYRFPTAHLFKEKRKIKGWWAGRTPTEGVVAHQDFSGHADGRYILEWLEDADVPESGVTICPTCKQEVKL